MCWCIGEEGYGGQKSWSSRMPRDEQVLPQFPDESQAEHYWSANVARATACSTMRNYTQDFNRRPQSKDLTKSMSLYTQSQNSNTPSPCLSYWAVLAICWWWPHKSIGRQIWKNIFDTIDIHGEHQISEYALRIWLDADKDCFEWIQRFVSEIQSATPPRGDMMVSAFEFVSFLSPWLNCSSCGQCSNAAALTTQQFPWIVKVTSSIDALLGLVEMRVWVTSAQLTWYDITWPWVAHFAVWILWVLLQTRGVGS